jgi:phosphoribosylaminoimidazole synthetase
MASYSKAGVSIDAGNRAVALMRDAVRATYGPQVLAGIGAFGGLFDAAALKDMRAPVLVASTGHDLVNHCLNDILVQGARPLFFLDYVAASKLEPEMIAEVVGGLAAACRAAGCALLGGETAEMPGVYQPGEFDVAGTIVGVVERDDILPRPTVRPGDVLLGLRSSGPHTNGYSLIRKIFEGETLGDELADALLAPHRSYLQLLITNLHHIKALAHLTGGGFIENIPRVLPEGVGAVVRLGSWPIPFIFGEIQTRGDIGEVEMHRVFNMGIGMVAVCAREDAATVQGKIPEETFVIGELVSGERKVILQ